MKHSIHPTKAAIRALLFGVGLPLLASAQVPSLISHQGRVSVGGTNFTGTGQFRFALVDPGTNTARQATATAVVNSGFITSFVITDGGAGYTTAPAVQITDITGTGAVAQASIGGGAVTNIAVINPGSGYSSNPTVTLDPPPSNIVYQTYWSNGVNNVALTVTKGLYSVLLGDTTIPNMAALSAAVFTNSNVRLRVWFNDGVSGLQQLSPDQRLVAAGYALMAANVPDGAITSSKLATGAVGAAQITDGAISSSKLATGAVTTAALAAGAVGTTQIATGAVDNARLANNSITVTAGSGLNGGGTVPLGGSVSLAAAVNRDATLVGNGGSSSLGLNLANPNTWTALQTFSPGITVSGQVQAIRLNVGYSHFISGTGNTIAGGYLNTNTGNYAAVGGGYANTASGYATAIAGGYQNTASGTGAFIGGGGYDGFTAGWNIASGRASVIGGGMFNQATTNYATVAGGYTNTASGWYATVAGGSLNTASNSFATVAGGYLNTASGYIATVAGGSLNTASNSYATVAGGYRNTASGTGAFIGGGGNDGLTAGWNIASGRASVIGGGMFNQATNYATTVAGGLYNTASNPYATVAGGYQNTASGWYATVGGGYTNTASGYAATVAGGYGNTAGGNYSFAAGQSAMATNIGAFVWSSGSFATYSWGDYTFTVRASGGARFYSASTGTTNGVQLAAGAGSWSTLSDRNAKENFQPVNYRQILERLAAIPVATWNYKTQPATIRHIGPVAQDFAAAFGVGENDHSISTVDADGVALAAIKGLYEELQAEKARNDALEKRLAELERQLTRGGK